MEEREYETIFGSCDMMVLPPPHITRAFLIQMKTNQVMVRPMGQFKVEQRTKDAFFNATALLRQWNEVTNSKKELKDYLSNKSTKELIATINEREKLNGEKSPYLSNRGKNGGTWMHPILFVDYAMWLNSAFKYDVIKFVYDQMISYRNEAGDAYKELGKAVGCIVNKSFMPSAMSLIAKGINHIVFGEHGTLIRNQHGNEEKMRELFRFEHKVADLINEGFLTNFDGVVKYLRDMWKRQHTPKMFLE